jgi:hypothetical protein
MRRFFLVALVACTAIAVPALAGSSSFEFKADLEPESAVPPNTSDGEGEAGFSVSRSGRSIRYRIEAEDLTGRVRAAHIHLGREGQAGPVVITICARTCSLPRSGRLGRARFSRAPGARSFAAVVRALRAGRTYVNVHTKRYPGGELRGQIERDGR